MTDDKPVETAPYVADQPATPAVIKTARELRYRMLADPHRPGFHFAFPEDDGRPGDPNGAFYANGRYHLMYLYNHADLGFVWGHVSSRDLLHWRHHPYAIGPGEGDVGCFSGGAFVDKNGRAILSYWGLWEERGICLAFSEDEHYDKWTKSKANPIIRSTESGLTETVDKQGNPLVIGSSDPSQIWRKGDKYYLLTGNLQVLNKIGRADDAPPDQQGDRLYLFASEDLEKWEYLHPFYESRREWTDRSEDDMCPSFLPLPSSPDGGEIELKKIGKELMELEITIDPGAATQCGVKVCCSDDGREETVLFYDSAEEQLKCDTTRSGLDFGRKVVESAPFTLGEGELLKLRVFVDRSIVEVFANDRQAIGRAVYPTLGGRGVKLFAKGGEIKVASFNAWELMPSNPY